MEPTTDLLWITLVALSVFGASALLTLLTSSGSPPRPLDGPPAPEPGTPGRSPRIRRAVLSNPGAGGPRGGRIREAVRAAVRGGGFGDGSACSVESEPPEGGVAGSGGPSRPLVGLAVALAVAVAAVAVVLPGAPTVGAAPAPAPAPPAATGADPREGTLAVGFTFEPEVVKPGGTVRIHLSPPFPARVHLDGRELGAEIRNSGRTLLVRVPGDARPGEARLELVAGARRSAAPMPLRISGTRGKGADLRPSPSSPR